jgi:SAM-dependent methyltransferase
MLRLFLTFNGVLEDFAPTHQEKFDAVTSFEVMEHVPDVLSMLTAIRSVLKPEGVFGFSVPNLDDPYCLRRTVPVSTPPLHYAPDPDQQRAQRTRSVGLPAAPSDARSTEARRKGRRVHAPWHGPSAHLAP